MSNANQVATAETLETPTSLKDHPSTISSVKTGAWVTDRAWVCGIIGAFTVVACAVWYNITQALQKGVYLFGWQVTNERTESLLFALLVITAAMLIAEAIRLYIRDAKHFFVLAPQIQEKRYSDFLSSALANYLCYLLLFKLVVLFFQWGGEYGYQRRAAYYQAWFMFVEAAFTVYLWAGLPYVLLTRAFKHDPESDKTDLSNLVFKVITYLLSFPLKIKSWREPFATEHKKATRALLVKLFFTPLMTVFFCDQFPHLVSNVGYVFNTIPDLIASGNYNHKRFNNDFFNVSIALIFSIDVALAWVGYVISSRWVDNQTKSAEPTMLGWMVCITCYPPFQMFLGLYFPAPGEREVLRFDHQWVITFTTGLMLLSYFVYMSATMWFGVRFSNLTNRGIIRSGPYAIIRHPAYASKNFAWWCVMFPAVLFNAANTGLHVAIIQTIGLVFMTWIYYMRAITEERHLSADPYYLEYCKQVKYRFIPGVL
ncbi:hypothetical protein TDB9533_01606 [Thalassocella blandensis]|nr:hypothetical protein TDB9533_01606 [Thalassocella blandensis]